MKYLGIVFLLCTCLGALSLADAEYANAQGVKKNRPYPIVNRVNNKYNYFLFITLLTKSPARGIFIF